MSSIFAGPERGFLNALASQTRVQEVRSQEQLEAAIRAATYVGALPNDGIGRVPVTGAAIVIVESIELKRTILLPRRAIGVSISQLAKFPCSVTHSDPVFRVEGFAQSVHGLNFAVPAGSAGPSMFVELNADPAGDPSDFTMRDCIAWALEFVETSAGTTCERARVSGNVLVRSSGSSVDGINIHGNGVCVDGNDSTNTCGVTFQTGSTGTRCYGNDLDSGVVTFADIEGLNT